VAGKSAGFAIGVGINDAASAGLDAINKRIAALTAPADRFNKSLAKFGDVTGINRAAEGMQTLGDRALGAARAVERLAGPMVGITSAASLGGMVELSRRWADAGNSISKTANLLNTPVDRLSALRGAARLAGSSADAMDSSLKGLSETLHAAFYNRDATAQMNLKALGIDWRDEQGNITKTEDALGKLANKASTYTDKATAGRALAAVDVDKDLLPLLEKGQAGLDAFVARARETGGVMTAEMAANAKKMNSSWSELGLAIEGVGNRILDSWSGTATKVLDTTSHWIERNQALADSYGTNAGAVIGAVAALSAIKPAVWILRALGLLGPTELLAVAGGIGYLADKLPPAVTHDDTRTIFTPGGVTIPFAPSGSPFNPAPSSDDYTPPWYQRAWHRLGGGSRKSSVDLTMDPTKRGFLETLAGPESHGRYDIKNGWSPTNDNSRTRFSDYSQFPEGVAPGGTSTAAGKYQFISGTWRSVANAAGLTDFSPDSQDKGAWYLATTAYRARTGRDLEDDLKAGNHQMQIASALGSIWPSLPGGSQSNQSLATFGASLAANTAAAAANGHVQVDVHLHGAPPGTTASAVGTGAVSTSPPRIEHSMPMVGGTGGWS